MTTVAAGTMKTAPLLLLALVASVAQVGVQLAGVAAER